MNEPRRVLLLGGGYVTLHAYRSMVRRLRPQLRRGEVELVVLSADDAHGFHGFTGEVVAGLLPYELTRTPLVGALPRARVVHGRALRVDVGRRTVAYAPADGGPAGELSYDELVVGTGGREPVRDVPGLAEHGVTLRGPGEIAALVARVRSTLGSAARGDAAARTVLVAGGGLAGVELAAALAHLGRAEDGLRVVLVHSGPALVPALRESHPRLADRCATELARLGVEVRTGTRLASVTATRAVLSDGTTVATTTVLATTGQRPVVVPGLDDLPRDTRGRVVTARDLRAIDGVWAAGDVARVLHPRTGQPVPANALWAIKAGAHAGRNVARSLRGHRTRAFDYRGLGQAAAFAPGRAVAELYGVPLTGWTAWLLRLAFFLRFVPSRRTAVQVALELAAALRTHHGAVGGAAAATPAPEVPVAA